ncbi:MAG: phage tail tape measure protein [Proteobacteria bacterium]|nr:phage tail tape measure protein [Pseudomonadota bacterium]
MADLAKTVEIVFGGKNDLSRTIRSVEKDINSIADPLAGAAEKVLALDAALMAMAVGGMAYAIKTAGEFSGQFSEITTLLSDTGAPVETFRKDILDYSTDSVKSIDQINAAIYSAISAGVDYKDSVAFVNEAEKLSVAGRADLGATTVALISTLNAYGESTDQAGKYSDIMFNTVKVGQTTIEELASSLSKVTGIAANTGVPFETLSAAVAALTVAGAPTSEAITGIKAALTNIIKPSKDASDMADALGIQFNATALKTRGFEGVLKDVYTATGGNTEKMGKLFGSTEALNAVFVLAADKSGKFKDALESMGDAAGSTQIAYDKVANEFENVNQRLANNFEVTLITIGQKLLPEYGEIANSLSSVFKGIKVGIDAGAFDQLFDYLGKTGKSISEWLNEVAKAFPEALGRIDISGLISSLQSVGDAIAELFQTDKDAPEALAETIQFVVDSLKSLTDVTKGIGEVFAPLVNFAKEAVEGFNSLDGKTKELIGNVLGLSLAFKAFGPVSLIMLGLGSDTETATKIIRVSFAAVENGINALKVGVLALALATANAMLGMGKFLDSLPFYDNVEGIDRATERVKILGKALNEAEDDLEQSSRKVIDAFNGVDTSAKEFKKTIESTPKAINVTAGIKVEDTGKDSQEVIDLILHPNDYRKDPLIQSIVIQPDEKKLADTVKTVEEALPEEKKMLITPEIEIAKIKAQTDIIQEAISWKAKIDIAEIEAGTEKIKAAFDSINKTIESTGSLESDLFKSLLGDDVQGSKKWAIEEAIKKEQASREKALELQEDFTRAQIELMQQQASSLARGDAMITINGEGLQPHLEAFMFEILSAIQIRANAEGQNFLLGL